MKQFNKLLIQIHNLSGSILSLMFVVWFISGIVLIFDGFPHASRKQRFVHLQEFTSQQIFNALKQKHGIRKIEWKTVLGQPLFQVYYNDYQIPETYTLNAGSIVPVFKKHNTLRKIILILLSLTGLTISITDFVIGFNWFRRNFKTC